MKKKYIKRIAGMILSGIVLLYLAGLLYSTVLVFRMQELNYTAWGWGVVLVEYNLDFANHYAERNYYDFDGALSSHVEGAFSEGEQTEIRLVCAISLIPLWKSEYVDPYVSDGDQWEITIDDGEKGKSTYGYNAYPFTYRLVYGSIRSIFEREI